MNISECKVEVAVGKTNFGVDSSNSNAVFSGWDIASVETHSGPESEYRNFLLGKADYFRQRNLRHNRILAGLFPSCACLNLGQKFLRLAKENNKGTDNANAIIDLIMACAPHRRFAPTLSKLFPEFPKADAGDTVADSDGLLAGASGMANDDDASGVESKCQELPTDVSESGANRVDPPDESKLSAAITPVHANLADKPDSNWSTDRQKLFAEMRDMLAVQRMSINDTSDFRGQRSFTRDTGNNVNSCSSFGAHGLVTTGFYQLADDRSYEEQQLSKTLKQIRISHKSIRNELDDLFESLSDAAHAKLLPENCDLNIQIYKDGQQGHTMDFYVWQEGDQIKVSDRAPFQVDVQRQKAILRLTAESIAILNAPLVLDADIAFEQRWICVSGDSTLVGCIKTLIAQQKPRKSDASQEG